MEDKYFRITEVVEICGVEEAFILRLEEESLIFPVLDRDEKLYALPDVDRVRVARVLFEELGVNLEGIEVALHMREQMIAMQREFEKVLRAIAKDARRE
jgi:DNA-binding transcriptional MerR regulator